MSSQITAKIRAVSYTNLTVKAREWAAAIAGSNLLILCSLLCIKIAFQFIILDSGYRWLSADDFCRTVKSFEWYKDPIIYSGVWLSPHFWVNGFVMLFVKDLFTAATIVTFLFSFVSLIYFYLLIEKCFSKTIAFFSGLLFCFFPFQVWLSISGLPEPVFFCFAFMGIFYFIKWKEEDKMSFLLAASISFALGNLFRYEAWMLSAAFVVMVSLPVIVKRKISKQIIYDIAVSAVSGLTIIWWLLQNYIDHGDMMFFAHETTKIFEQFNTAGFLQRLVQYPVFIFYIAPVTTALSLKKIYDCLRKPGNRLVTAFLLINLIQLLLLMLQGVLGTGGTNMISRYIVLNAMLFLPFAVMQIFELKKYLAVIVMASVITINIIWSFYYPQPFREDTFETGYHIKNLVASDYFGETGNIYFEEIDGYFDVFGVQTLSNRPDKFVLGYLPALIQSRSEPVKKKQSQLPEDINIVEIKNFLESKNINLAVIKSDGYFDKLKKLSKRYEEIGEYKLFYFKVRESSINDSTISLFTDNITNLSERQVINFNKVIGLNNVSIDNTHFGLNPQTVTIDWTATDEHILDSLDFKTFDFNRFKAVVDIVNPDTDSIVYSQSSNIFSEQKVEELVESNSVRQIIVLKPFAVLQYSRKYLSSPFEGGIYKLQLKVVDSKYNNDLLVYRGFEPLKTEPVETDSTLIKTADSLGLKVKDSLKTNVRRPDSLQYSYNLGNIIAMFPDSDYNKIVEKKKDFIEITTRNWLQLLFSQRYQGDQVLNWVFTYF